MAYGISGIKNPIQYMRYVSILEVISAWEAYILYAKSNSNNM